MIQFGGVCAAAGSANNRPVASANNKDRLIWPLRFGFEWSMLAL